MEQYDHFKYGEHIARHLKPISHTDKNPKFFPAFGLEDLYQFDEKLSSVTGTILIAVDGLESNSDDNGADSLNDHHSYSFIIARNTDSDRSATITAAAKDCSVLAKQIRNLLFHAPNLADTIERKTEITGIGPIGDNFYGVILTFTLRTPEDFFIDQTFWNDGVL